MEVLRKNTGVYTSKSKGRYLRDLFFMQSVNKFSDEDILRFVAEEFPDAIPLRKKRLEQARSEYNGLNGGFVPEYDEKGSVIYKAAHRPKKVKP